jgi:hypothetical protein
MGDDECKLKALSVFSPTAPGALFHALATMQCASAHG